MKSKPLNLRIAVGCGLLLLTLFAYLKSLPNADFNEDVDRYIEASKLESNLGLEKGMCAFSEKTTTEITQARDWLVKNSTNFKTETTEFRAFRCAAYLHRLMPEDESLTQFLAQTKNNLKEHRLTPIVTQSTATKIEQRFSWDPIYRSLYPKYKNLSPVDYGHLADVVERNNRS